jgi:hypothetical protein
MFGEAEPHISKATTNVTESFSLQTRGNSDLVFCPVRSQPGDTLDNITMYLSIYIPTFLGPVISIFIFIISLPFSHICSDNKVSCCSCFLLPSLVIVHLATYYTHLLLSDRLHLEEFHFIVVKYGVGFSFIIIVPFLVIASRPDIRLGVRKTFKSSVLCAQKKVYPEPK